MNMHLEFIMAKNKITPFVKKIMPLMEFGFSTGLIL